MSPGEPPSGGRPVQTLLTIAQVMERLGCSRRTIYRRFDEGELVRVRIGGVARVPVWSVEQFERKQVEAMSRRGLTYDELALRWAVSRRTLHRLVADGALVQALPDPVDGWVRVPLESIEAFEAAHGGLDQAGPAALSWITSGGR